jgi:hypothetical protein
VKARAARLLAARSAHLLARRGRGVLEPQLRADLPQQVVHGARAIWSTPRVPGQITRATATRCVWCACAVPAGANGVLAPWAPVGRRGRKRHVQARHRRRRAGQRAQRARVRARPTHMAAGLVAWATASGSRPPMQLGPPPPTQSVRAAGCDVAQHGGRDRRTAPAAQLRATGRAGMLGEHCARRSWCVPGAPGAGRAKEVR